MKTKSIHELVALSSPGELFVRNGRSPAMVSSDARPEGALFSVWLTDPETHKRSDEFAANLEMILRLFRLAKNGHFAQLEEISKLLAFDDDSSIEMLRANCSDVREQLQKLLDAAHSPVENDRPVKA